VKRFGSRRPRPVAHGDRIDLWAPGGALRAAYRDEGLAWLREEGFPPQAGDSLYAKPGPFGAGPASARLADLDRALQAQTSALLPARGGYGCVHLLDAMPWTRIAALAPMWIGASDLTFLQTPLLQRYGFVTWYGPMPCGQLARGDAAGRTAYLRTLRGEASEVAVFPQARARIPRPVEGELRGGCLSILAAQCGTIDQLDATDAVVILEDIGEHPFRIERMLEQLHRSGALHNARALLFGTFPGCVNASGDETLVFDVVTAFAERLALPTMWYVPIGHAEAAIPLPLGIPVRVEEHTVTLLESPYA